MIFWNDCHINYKIGICICHHILRNMVLFIYSLSCLPSYAIFPDELRSRTALFLFLSWHFTDYSCHGAWNVSAAVGYGFYFHLFTVHKCTMSWLSLSSIYITSLSWHSYNLRECKQLSSCQTVTHLAKIFIFVKCDSINLIREPAKQLSRSNQ